MTATIIECEQGTAEWHQARLGLPTASEFGTVTAKNREGSGPGLTRQTYLRKLAGEIITGEPMENYTNANMERGKLMEAEARALYCFMADVETERVGFIRNGQKGCSPDSLLGPNGMLEIKTAFPHILIDKLLKNEFPPEHKAQCQGALWVAEREWIDIAIYWPKMPLFLMRAGRDDKYIATLAAEVDRFNGELAQMVDRIRAFGLRAAA